MDTRYPLAYRIRPTTLGEFIGQEHILGPGTLLHTVIRQDKLRSAIFYGPPGTGKTTLAEIIAQQTKAHFIRMNATTAGVKDVREAIRQAHLEFDLDERRTVVFLDECVPHDALILCRSGDIIKQVPIGEIVNNRIQCEAFSYDEESQCLEWKAIDGWMIRPPRPMVEIWIGEETVLRCSTDHPVYTANRGYVAAKDLIVTDELMVLDAKMQSHVVPMTTFGKLSHAEILYDLSVQDNHNFFADNVLVHNCHRFSRNQQDAFLSSVEDGTIALIGALVSNPYFAVVGPLLSRSEIFEFEPLSDKDLAQALIRAVDYYKTEGITVTIDGDAVHYLTIKANGDARKIITALELAVESFHAGESEVNVDLDLCKRVMPRKSVLFDRSGDSKYNYASALQGSIQASDPDAAVYWLARSIAAGEDPAYIARRMLVSAAEDVGVGDPIAIPLAWSVLESCRSVGLPECALHLSTLVIYLATNKRNKSAAMAIGAALSDIREGKSVAIPPEMKDCHYEGAEQLGQGAYQDGANMDAYVGIAKRYYKPEDWE